MYTMYFKKDNMLTLLIIYGYILIQSEAARILGVISIPSYSHQIVFQPLWKELSLRGHQVTVIAPDPINDPTLTNLTEIDVHTITYEYWNAKIQGEFEKDSVTLIRMFDLILNTTMVINDLELRHPQVQDLIKNKKHNFDLVISEVINPIMFAFAEHFKCPSIGVISLEGLSQFYRNIGNVPHPVINPDVTMPFEDALSFSDRFLSVVNYIITWYYIDRYYGMSQEIVENHFGKDFPNVKEIVANMSIFFVNTNHIIFPVRQTTPNVIYIGGGFHIKSPKLLPEDLKTFMDKSTEGIIYFSLGTNIKSKDISTDTRKVLMETFSQLPYKILWKFELDELPNQPKNVMIKKWLPQQDVLRHPNVKLFITQGGMQSLEESLFSHVPVLGLPFFADQEANVKRFVLKGLGLSLVHFKLSTTLLKETINELISNPSYKNRAMELSNLILDQPLSPLERAVWWVEYVLRHKGAKHYRSRVLDIPFYQYYLLDIIGVILITFLILTILILKIVGLSISFVPKQKVKKS